MMDENEKQKTKALSPSPSEITITSVHKIKPMPEIIATQPTRSSVEMRLNPNFRAILDAPLMPLPPEEGMPEGLELLEEVNYVFMKTRVEAQEAFLPMDARESYDIHNLRGQRIYYANEKADGSPIYCLGNVRPFTLDILDFGGRTVLHVERPRDCRLYLTLFPCCFLGSIGGGIKVYLGNGELLGRIVHKFSCCCCSCCSPQYNVLNAEGRHALTIGGPKCADCCLINCCNCGSYDFPITLVSTGVEVGCVTKEYAKYMQSHGRPLDAYDEENLIGFETFGLVVSIDLDVGLKGLLLAAAFLIHFMYNEAVPLQDRRQSVVSDVDKFVGKPTYSVKN